MITRRSILQHIGMAGGAAATFGAMEALGIAGNVAAAAPMPDLPAGFGKGRSVIVLGAGIAGLVAAYELQQAGFDVTCSRRATGSAGVTGRCATATGS